MAKNFVVTIFCLALALGKVAAQSTFLDVENSNNNISYYAEQKLNASLYEYLNKTYRINSNSYLSVSWKLDLSKVTMLEGMNTQLSGDPRIAFRLSNKLDNKDSVFYYKKNIKTASKNELADQLVESYLADKSNLNMLGKDINTFFQNQFGKNCEKGIEKVKSELEAKNFTNALHLIGFYNTTACKKSTVELKAKVLEEYGKQVCENDMDRIKILANSGIEYQMVTAVDMLYRIPPKSPCSAEAIKVSKEIGDYFLKKSSSPNKQLNTLIQIYTNTDIEAWNALNMF